MSRNLANRTKMGFTNCPNLPLCSLSTNTMTYLCPPIIVRVLLIHKPVLTLQSLTFFIEVHLGFQTFSRVNLHKNLFGLQISNPQNSPWNHGSGKSKPHPYSHVHFYLNIFVVTIEVETYIFLLTVGSTNVGALICKEAVMAMIFSRSMWNVPNL